MRRLLVSCVAILLSLSVPVAAQQAIVPVDDVAAIAQASKLWDELYAAGDAAKLAERYDEDAVSMPPGIPALVGKTTIAADFRTFFESNSATHQTLEADRRIVGDLAIERARYEATISPKAGGDVKKESGKHVVVYRRQADGSWKVLWEIWNSDE